MIVFILVPYSWAELVVDWCVPACIRKVNNYELNYQFVKGRIKLLGYVNRSDFKKIVYVI